MSIHNKIAWEEGMFLAPQHFQQHDRYLENLIHQKTTRAQAYLWGIKSLKLDPELLNLGRVGFIECRGILPDGTVFDVPHEDEPPTPLVITDTVVNKHVYLGIALKQAGVHEIGTEREKQQRYTIAHRDIADTIAGYDDTIEVPLAQLNLHLYLEGPDTQHYIGLPIAFIKEAQPQQKIILDDYFIPSCFLVSAVPRLLKLTQEIYSLLHHRGEMLSYRLTQTQAQTAMILDFMLLQVINRYESYFNYLQQEQEVHPLEFYRACIQLAGELSTFTEDTRRAPRLPSYQHMQLTSTFQVLMESLRKNLSMVIEQHTMAIPLTEHEHGIWIAAIENKEILKSMTFVLAVYADVPAEMLRMNFPKQAKVAPMEQIQQLITRQLPGIELQLLPMAPRQIPVHANYTYFTLNKKHETWKYLEKSAGLAIYLGAHYPNPKLELWAMKG